MNHEQAKEFLQAIGVSKTQASPKWLRASCPLAPWKHKSGSDRNPSFGVSLSSGRSNFNCFSCSSSGSLSDLLNELSRLTKDSQGHYMDLARAYKILDSEIKGGYVLQKDWSMESQFIFKKPTFWDESWLNHFLPFYKAPIAVDYLRTRKVDMRVATSFDIRYDQSKNAVCVPIRYKTGELVGMRGRLLDPKSPLRYFDYGGSSMPSNTSTMWLNHHRVNQDKPVVVAEGMFDVFSIFRVYENVMSPLSVSMNPEKIKCLSDFPSVICFFDNDEAGNNAYKKVKSVLGNNALVKKVEYPPELALKDPGEFSAQQISHIFSQMI